MAHKNGPPPLCSILGSRERKREFKNFQQLFCRKKAVKLKKIRKSNNRHAEEWGRGKKEREKFPWGQISDQDDDEDE